MAAGAALHLAHQHRTAGVDLDHGADSAAVAVRPDQVELQRPAEQTRVVAEELQGPVLVDDRHVDVAVAVVVGDRAAASVGDPHAGLAGDVPEGAVAVVGEEQVGPRAGHGRDEQVLVTVVVGVEEVDAPGVVARHAGALRRVVCVRPARMAEVEDVPPGLVLQGRAAAVQVGDVEVPGAVAVDVGDVDPHAGLRVVADPVPVAEHLRERPLGVAEDLVDVARSVGVVAGHVDHVQVGPQVGVEMGSQHQEGPPVRSDALIQAGGGSRIGECPVTEVAVQAVARGGRPGGVDDQVGDVQVDAAVAVVIQPRRRLGAVAGQRPVGRGGQVVDPGGGCHFLEQRAAGGNAAAVLHQQVAQQQVGRSVRNVLAVQRPLDVVRVDVDVGVAVVVVVGEDGARHLVVRQFGNQVVRRLEAAIAQVAVQPRRVAGVAAHREQVGPAVGVHVDPVHAQAVRGACEEPLGADAGRGGDVGEADGRVPHHGRVRGGAFDVCHRCRGGHAQGGRLLRQEPGRSQHGKTAGHRDRPGAQRVGADPSPAERPRQAPEGDRPAGRCREQQRRRRRATGAEQQQQRHQRNLEQQRHVDQHPERGRDGDAGYAVAQEGVDGLRPQELDGGAAREPGDHHDRPHADRHATGRTRPAPQPSPHLRGPAQTRLGRGRKAQVTSLRLRGAARHARDQRAEQKGGGKPQQHAAGAQQRGEHDRDHHQRRHVEGGRAVHERQRPLDPQPAAAHGAGHRDDAGRA